MATIAQASSNVGASWPQQGPSPTWRGIAHDSEGSNYPEDGAFTSSGGNTGVQAFDGE